MKKIPGSSLSSRVSLQLSRQAHEPQSAEPAEGDLEQASIEELVEAPVVTASRRPAACGGAGDRYMVKEEDIVRYGLRNLRDAMRIIPGAEWFVRSVCHAGGSARVSRKLCQHAADDQRAGGGEPPLRRAYISYQFETHNVPAGRGGDGAGLRPLRGERVRRCHQRGDQAKDPTMATAGYIEQDVGVVVDSVDGARPSAHAAVLSFYGAVNYLITAMRTWVTG